ncbi:MAG TPA: SEC-C metal-binding domain-containing protein, partial [Bdellovibrionales bacterium]|nr:SEC-C metal-binding domain-containing protein [Bdellovibrionales bacterium]
IEDCYKRGQPVLVGTVSIERSELISRHLSKFGIPHKVLNAKHHEKEAEIVAQAGRKGSVTIATNMAGRGTDIVLGGNPEGLARQKRLDEATPEYADELAKLKSQCEKEKQEVIAAGGLCIIGTERHESRRIDNQLRGRSGRQGDPGLSRFYLSLEDNLMRIFNGERIQRIMNTLRVPEDEPIEAPMVTRAIEGAQRKVEGHNFDIRKHLLEYDDVMNKQRTTIYSLRREVLQGVAVEEIVLDMMASITSDMLDMYAAEDVKSQDWDLEGLRKAIHQQFGAEFDPASLGNTLSSETLTEAVKKAVKGVYERQKQTLGPLTPEVQKMILLQTIDTLWKEHLFRMDHLKEGINLRAYAQKDPLIEYKKEAFNAFAEMDHNIKAQTVEKFLKIQLVAHEHPEGQLGHDEHEVPGEIERDEVLEEKRQALEALAPKPQRQRMTLSHPSVNGPTGPAPKAAEPVRKTETVGRNDPCPCGSGKKYKKCHGANAELP